MTGAFIVPRLQQLIARALSLPLTRSLTEPGAVAKVALPRNPLKNLPSIMAVRFGADATGMIMTVNNAVDAR